MEDERVQNETTNKEASTKDKVKAIVFFIVVGILPWVWLFRGCSVESQYSKDAKSLRGKTYKEMTNGEKKVFNDYLKWKIKQK